MAPARNHEILKVKVCLVGESVVGKTSLIRRLVLDQYDDRYVQTLGAKVSKKELLLPNFRGGRQVKVAMTIWDIMGSPGIPELMREGYFYQAQGILAVCDATRRDTLLALGDWYQGLTKICGGAPWVLLANKVDLAEMVQLTATDLEEFREGVPYMFTSAKTGQGVEEAFMTLAGRVAQGLLQRPRGRSLVEERAFDL